MIKYRLYGRTGVKSINDAFESICKSVTKILKIKDELEFDVNIVDSKTIRKINKTYRKIDKVTDVISFANRDNNLLCVSLIGEIFICLTRAKQQAKEYRHTIERELIFLFTHGLLHLLGYDHMNKKDEKVMFSLTDKVINNANLPAKYIIK